MNIIIWPIITVVAIGEFWLTYQIGFCNGAIRVYKENLKDLENEKRWLLKQEAQGRDKKGGGE